MAQTPKHNPQGNRRRTVTRLKKPPRPRRDPHAWGLVIGVAVAVLTLLIALARQYGGAIMAPSHLAVWVLLAFVVSYGAGGCFVYLLMTTAKQELARQKEAAAHEAASASAQTAQETAPTEGGQPGAPEEAAAMAEPPPPGG
jgi:hypothetical protein